MSFLRNELPVMKANQHKLSCDLNKINSQLADITKTLARMELKLSPSEDTTPAATVIPPTAVFPASTIAQFNINEGMLSGNPVLAPVRYAFRQNILPFRSTNTKTGNSEPCPS